MSGVVRQWVSIDQFNRRLLEETERRFGFEKGASKALESSRSLTYCCQRGYERFILKIRPFGVRRTADYTMGELEFLEHLAASGICVPRAISSLSGELIEVYHTEHGEYMAYAYEKIEGRLIGWKEWNPALFQKWGAMVGRIHSATKDFELSIPAYMRKLWYEDEEYDLDRTIPASQLEILAKGKELLNRLRSLPKDRDSYGLVHEDLHQWNFFIHDGELIPFDFEDCLYDWFAGDFSAAIHNANTGHSYHYGRGEYEYWTSGNKMDGPTFVDYFMRHFMEGYSRENSLDSFWLRQLPDFVRRRHLSTYVTRINDQAEVNLSEVEQMADFPWRSIKQHAEQVLDDGWADSLFEKFLARL